MNWIFTHSDLCLIIALVGVPLLMIGGMMIISNGNAPEASDLQGAPETLGDFPPLGAWEQAATKISHIEIDDTINGEFPAGAYVYISPDGNHIALATEETHNAIADGKGGYIQ